MDTSIQLNSYIIIRNSRGTGDFFTVTGIVDLGAEQANAVVFLSLDRARSFLGLNGVSSIEVKVRDVFAADGLASRLRAEFNRAKVESWQERNRELLTALWSQEDKKSVFCCAGRMSSRAAILPHPLVGNDKTQYSGMSN